MSKITNFARLIKQIPRSHFESIVHKHNADHRVRSLDSWTWFGALMFSQFSGHDSLRAIESVFTAGKPIIQKLGFKPICRSTLSDANAVRPVEMLEDIYKLCLTLAQRYKTKNSLDLDLSIYLMDSTFIELCLSLCPWAYYRRSDAKTGNTKYGGIKMHTAIDLTGHLPEFILLKAGTESENGDLKIACKHFNFKENSLVVFDRGYWSLAYFNELNIKKVSFITRQRNPRMSIKVHKSHTVDRTRGLICDQEVYFNSSYSKGKYAGKLRRISYRDPETKKKYIFITNRFDLSAEKICQLYKARWQVELFFRTMKQHFRLKKFLGLNINAVKAQIYTALISYILIFIKKQETKGKISMPDLMALVSVFLLINQNIFSNLDSDIKTRRHPPKEETQLSLFLNG